MHPFLQHFCMLSGAAQYAAVHAVYLAVRLEEGGVIAAGDKGLLFLHAGQQILLAAMTIVWTLTPP